MAKRIMKKELLAKGTGKLSRAKALSTDTGNLGNATKPIAPDSLSPYDIFLRCIKRAQNLLDFRVDKKCPSKKSILMLTGLQLFYR